MKERLQSFLSRKFLLSVAGIIFFILGGILGKFDWQAVIDGVKLIVLGYISIEGVGDAAGRISIK